MVGPQLTSIPKPARLSMGTTRKVDTLEYIPAFRPHAGRANKTQFSF
jgi:hypothetical protein